MNAPKEILDFFTETVKKFQNGDPSIATLREGLVPVLKVLCNLVTGHRLIRKYYRNVVLPPLRDVNHRPEVGD
jgi:hypothetical protein